MNGIQRLQRRLSLMHRLRQIRFGPSQGQSEGMSLSAYQEQAYIQSPALLERSERESALSGRTPLPCCNLSGAQFTAQYRAGNEGACLCRGIKATVGIAGRGIRRAAGGAGGGGVVHGTGGGHSVPEGPGALWQAGGHPGQREAGDGHLTLSVQTRPIRAG